MTNDAPQLPTPRSVVRVSFGQVSDGHVTASLRHSRGPLIPGETVVAYELDDGEMLYVTAQVVRFDDSRAVAQLKVRVSDVRIAQARPVDVDRPWDYFMRDSTLPEEDPLAVPV